MKQHIFTKDISFHNHKVYLILVNIINIVGYRRFLKKAELTTLNTQEFLLEIERINIELEQEKEYLRTTRNKIKHIPLGYIIYETTSFN